MERVKKSVNSQQHEQQQPIIDELREGLSSSYRQLRELLTTYRLKIEAGGLQSPLSLVISQLNERSDLTIRLHYKLSNIPLRPTEEIHLLQIILEASQNAVNHSWGSEVDIILQQKDDHSIELLVEDNGIGIPPNAERRNHYGLAIINERSRHLIARWILKPDSKAEQV